MREMLQRRDTGRNCSDHSRRHLMMGVGIDSSELCEGWEVLRCADPLRRL